MANSWNILLDTISVYLAGAGYKKEDTYFFKHDAETHSFFMLPVSKIEYLRELRIKYKYSSPAIILIKGKHQNPYRNNECLFPEDKKIFFGNPEYGNIKKAILFGELDDIKNENKMVFDVTHTDWEQTLLSLIEDIKRSEYKKEFLKKYYETFIDYYFPDKKDITDIDKIDFTVECKLKDNEGKEVNVDIPICKGDFEIAEKAYCKLNVIDYNEQVHRVKFELFRAPVPFPLQDLIDAEKEIRQALGWHDETQGKKIKLLLIDNKTDKFKKESKDTIFDALSKFNLSDLFDISMLQGHQPDNNCDSEPEQFHDDKFRSDKSYSMSIYEKVKDSHFILLDFFLDRPNTYLAFDFIEDISKIKKREGDYSTTWYFITSAVYDSVVKYSQSGLLAEYYESAVVNAGDDPTNEKRQIIFIYKLLTFIQARLRSFKNYKEMIFDQFKKDGKCTKYNKENRMCINCLEKNLLSLTKKYLAEYPEITKIFQIADKDFKSIVEVFDNLINQFLWLPEAEWQIVQHQIDYINAKLKDIGEGRKFSCNYINEEIRQRSEIY